MLQAPAGAGAAAAADGDERSGGSVVPANIAQPGAAPRLRAALRRRRVVLSAFLASRLLVVVAQQVARLSTGRPVASRWDGYHYLLIARSGYPTTLQRPGERFSEWAFFPLFPLVVRGVHDATGLSLSVSALALNWLLQLVLAVVFWQLAAAVTSARSADRASLLLWFFPGSVVLAMGYSEALFLVAAAGALLCLVRRRWLLAGLLGACASATRPDGLAVAAACVVAAVIALRRPSRDWPSLLAPVIAPLGFVAFLAYSRARTGDGLVWLRAERLWGQHLDLNLGLPAYLVRNLAHHTLSSVNALYLGLGAVVLVVAVVVAVRDRHRLPAPLWAFLVVLIGLSAGDTHVGARPRFLLAMLPLFIVLGARLRGIWLSVTVGSASGLLCLTGFAYLAVRHVIP